MKQKHLILFLAVVLAACSTRHPVETRQGTSLPNNMACQQLQAIDSLMWQHPDSALMVLVDFAGSPKADSLSSFDGHYFQMLLSELLYKNDCEQSNRAELLKAVDYFDSLTIVLNDNPQPRSRHCGLGPQSPGHYDNLVFLDARAHYINGAGFYERDCVVEACAEYLKALKVMESHFKEKDLLKNKAKFMAYSYNRLGEMFSEQFMMENAITCFEKSLIYCKIEPTSPTGIANTLFLIGKQYDKMNDYDEAKRYYDCALKDITDTGISLYRNIVSGKALCDYNCGMGMEKPIEALEQIARQSDDETERLTRYWAIGAIFFEEKMLDSAFFYLKPVYENTDDISVRNQIAGCLRVIYENAGDQEKADECVRFMAGNMKPEGENQALVSQLDNLFQDYLKQKQKKLAEAEHAKHIKKTVGIIVTIAILLVLGIVVVAKRRSRKLLRQQKEEADRQHKEELRLRQAEAEKVLEEKEKHHQQEIEAKEARARKELEERDKQHIEVLEAERQTHRMEQAAISGRLKHSHQEVRELKEKIRQQEDLAAKSGIAASFNEEPICRLIMECVHDGQFKSKIDCELYKSYALDKQQLLDLRVAADRHFSQFTLRLRKAYPKLTSIDIDYCCLYLLGLTDADISALMQRAYNTVNERSTKLRNVFGRENNISNTLRDLAECFLLN